ncbi:MAG: hypothetical protein H8D58_00090 [Candidatus Marinimicrobia bacterium]|jgi:hypothetical protein|nr:hypothetical protein [Candidatus Neomarinimicrobiota bacterium]MBT3945544.1 hypothetical protein [Candidatus Neomarinimicrobiota bacterium]MBT4154152.1 hypothetical protein [Candidatus Neomarinimicrobiota bacterium]MBT7042660.1 hypothetical protein [Candidatus Neomarinimicrobiota bacterium]MBT7515387.1 hypothetical protein [Candidatus Neomarinimicrobiota bacterium]
MAQTIENEPMPGRVITKLNIDPIVGIDTFIQSSKYLLLKNEYGIQWNASKHSSGLYFVELMTGDKRDVQKLIFLK